MRAIFIAVNTDGIKLFRSISDMVCLETPACLAVAFGLSHLVLVILSIDYAHRINSLITL